MAHYDIAHDSVVIPRKGEALHIKGIWYEVIRTVTEQTEIGQFDTMVTLAALDGNGDIVDLNHVTINLDTVDYTY